MDVWQVLPAAVALVFVIEGLLPVLSPEAWRSMVARAASLPTGLIRGFGLASLLFGAALFHLVR